MNNRLRHYHLGCGQRLQTGYMSFYYQVKNNIQLNTVKPVLAVRVKKSASQN